MRSSLTLCSPPMQPLPTPVNRLHEIRPVKRKRPKFSALPLSVTGACAPNTVPNAKLYTATVVGSEDLNGRKHWKIEAVAKDTTVAYPKRLIWVDAEYRTPTKQELFVELNRVCKEGAIIASNTSTLPVIEMAMK